jgi:predicted permease
MALLTVSFVQLARLNPGFVASGVLTMRITLPANRYAEASGRTRLYDQVLDVLTGVPGVAQATWTSKLPLEGEDWVDVVAPVGQQVSLVEQPVANYRIVAPGFFRTLSVPIRRGRAFTRADREGPTIPALVSERTAERVWPAGNALGQQFHRGDPNDKPLEVVGIVADGRMTRLDAPPPLMVYVPYWYRSRLTASLAIRTELDPTVAAGPIWQAIWSLDRDIIIADVQPMTEVAAKGLTVPRYQMLLFIAFGVSALIIAVVGVYAVTAYAIARRRREMNIRVALGAQVSRVKALILRQSGWPIAVGLTAGVLGALGLGNVLASMLVDTRSRDPLALAAVVVTVGAAALLSMIVAMRRGLAIDPASALRDE